MEGIVPLGTLVPQHAIALGAVAARHFARTSRESGSAIRTPRTYNVSSAWSDSSFAPGWH
jgi:hypothetical protein